MFKTIVSAVSILALVGCASESETPNIALPCDEVSDFAYIVMEARQNEVEKDVVVQTVVDSSAENNLPADVVELNMQIVDRAYDMPVLETVEEKEQLAEDFAFIILDICEVTATDSEEIDPALIA